MAWARVVRLVLIKLRFRVTTSSSVRKFDDDALNTLPPHYAAIVQLDRFNPKKQEKNPSIDTSHAVVRVSIAYFLNNQLEWEEGVGEEG